MGLILTVALGSILAMASLGGAFEQLIAGETKSEAPGIVSSGPQASLVGTMLKATAHSSDPVDELARLTTGKYLSIPSKLDTFEGGDDFRTGTFTKATTAAQAGASRDELAAIFGGGTRGRFTADVFGDVIATVGRDRLASVDIARLDSNRTGGATTLFSALEGMFGGRGPSTFKARMHRAMDWGDEVQVAALRRRLDEVFEIFDTGLETPQALLERALSAHDARRVAELERIVRLNNAAELLSTYSEDVQDLVARDVILPIAFPERARRFGVGKKQGVVFSGPAGTGKTRLARGVAELMTSDENIRLISGAELTQKFVGETEQNMRQLFSDALAVATPEEPAVIIFDELDGVIPKDPNSLTGGSQSRRSAFLSSLSNALEDNPNLILFGTTNKFDTLDPALLRPGRFETDIRVGYPEAPAIQSATRAFLRGVDHEIDESWLVRSLRGYSLADAKSIISDAKRHAMGDSLSDATVKLARSHVERALDAATPSVLRQNSFEIDPNVRLANVGGQDDAVATVQRRVLRPLMHAERYQELGGTGQPRNVVLVGPPGVGKSLISNAVANEAEAHFIAAKAADFATPEEVDAFFERASDANPAVVLIEEVDSVGGVRDGANNRVLNAILSNMEGLNGRSNVAIMASTNHYDDLDPALRRRLGMPVYMPLPDLAGRRQILGIHTSKRPLSGGRSAPDLDDIARRTDRYSGSDLRQLIEEAAEFTMDRDGRRISGNDFDRALERVKPSISRADEKRYRPKGQGEDFPIGFARPARDQ